MRTAFLLLLFALLSSAVFTGAQGREQTLQIPAPPAADAIGTRIDPANRSEPAVNTYVREVTISGPTRINRSGLEYYEVKGTIEGVGWGGASGGVRYESHYTYKVPYVLRIPVGWHGTLVTFRHGNAAFEAWAGLERLFGPRSIGRVFQDYGDRVVSDAALHPMRQWAYFSVNYTPLAIDGRPSSFLLPGPTTTTMAGSMRILSRTMTATDSKTRIFATVSTTTATDWWTKTGRWTTTAMAG
jgi:hypothetical protein